MVCSHLRPPFLQSLGREEHRRPHRRAGSAAPPLRYRYRAAVDTENHRFIVLLRIGEIIVIQIIGHTCLGCLAVPQGASLPYCCGLFLDQLHQLDPGAFPAVASIVTVKRRRICYGIRVGSGEPRGAPRRELLQFVLGKPIFILFEHLIAP